MFSNQNAQTSLEVSNNVIVKLAEIVKNRPLAESEKQWVTKKYLFLVRKSAHFFLYFTLSVLIFLLLKEFTNNNVRLILITIALCMIYAITDELHQSLIDGRTSKVIDVFIDTAGATFGTLLSYLALKLRKKHIKKMKWYIILNRGEEICL